MLGLTLRHTPFDELTATLMLLIETLSRKTELSVSYAMKIGHSALGLILIIRMNLFPKSRCYKVNARSQRNHAVIAYSDIGANLQLPAFVKGVYVETLVEFMVTGDDDSLQERFGTPVP